MVSLKLKPLAVVMTCTTVIITSGCTTLNDKLQVVYGCTTGAILGAVGGVIIGKGDPTYIAGGTVAGLAAGCGVGLYLQQREEKLAENAQKHGFDSEFVRISEKDGVASKFSKDEQSDVIASQMTISSKKPIFKLGKSRITDKQKLANLDSFIKEYIKGMDARSKIFIVGHTDTTGSALYNQKLSEKRAEFIAKRFLANGAPKEVLYFEGVGESQPIASNDTEIGRAKNRRFELIDIFSDSYSSKAVPLAKVAEVSRAKKQQITNVMNDQGRSLVQQHRNVETNQSKEKTSPPKLTTVDNGTSTSPKETKTTHILDKNSLKLEGDRFDHNRTSSQLTQKLGQFQDDSWNFISKAYATPAFIDSCALSEPRTQSKILTFGKSEKLSNTSDYLPSMIGNLWYNKVNKDKTSTMVLLGPVRVNKDTYESEGTPYLAFIKNYKSASQTIDYTVNLNVETYRGDDAVLYRVYPKEKSSIQCADFVFSTKGELESKYSEIVYSSRGATFSKVMTLKTKL